MFYLLFRKIKSCEHPTQPRKPCRGRPGVCPAGDLQVPAVFRYAVLCYVQYVPLQCMPLPAKHSSSRPRRGDVHNVRSSLRTSCVPAPHCVRGLSWDMCHTPRRPHEILATGTPGMICTASDSGRGVGGSFTGSFFSSGKCKSVGPWPECVDLPVARDGTQAADTPTRAAAPPL